jgi:hypothetical protein
VRPHRSVFMKAKALLKVLWVIVALHLAGAIFAPLPHEARLTLVRLSVPFLWLGMGVCWYYQRKAWNQLEVLWSEIAAFKEDPSALTFPRSHAFVLQGCENQAQKAHQLFQQDDWEECEHQAGLGRAAITEYRNSVSQRNA